MIFQFYSRSILGIVLTSLAFTGCANDVQRTPVPDVDNLGLFERNAQDRVFSVKGAVRSPGKIHMGDGEKMTLSEAILKAGGGEDLSYAKIYRLESDGVFMFKVSLGSDKAKPDFPILPGDIIEVSR
ncbi:MAG TPA: hypothetical protein VHY09_10875 [Candidatus Methylacidiphilales bacterium]|nr:hypothetical protein [Candidatus Methylacidiphilales bacterium]